MSRLTIEPPPTELGFFAAQTARVTHQITNVLTILNELAGLLEDLAPGAQDGRLTAQQLQELAQRMVGNVARATDIVRMLNRFAHTADDAAAEVDLVELVGLFAGLSARPLQLCGGRLDLLLPNHAMHRKVSAFGLLRLLDATRDVLCGCATGPPSLTLTLAPDEAPATLELSLADAPGDAALEAHLPALGALAAAVDIDVLPVYRPAGRVGIVLTWPSTAMARGGGA